MQSEKTPVPEIADQRVPPPGILPRNIQPWLMGGIALVMVIVILLSGKSSQKAKPVNAPGLPATVQQPNGDRLNDYKKRIEDETRKLELEKAQINQFKRAFPGQADSSAFSPGTGGPGGNPYAAPPASLPQNPQLNQAPPQKSWMEQEQEKRNYTSLFASNLVSSNREPEKQSSGEPSNSTTQGLPTVDPRLYSLPLALPPTPPVAPSAPEATKPNGVPTDTAKPVDRDDHSTKTPQPDLNRSNGNDHRLFEGTIIETALTNRLDGTFAGPVDCIVTYDVYSHDHVHVLIPAGSRVLGSVHPVNNTGQQRLAVTFHRVIMPDGYSVNLDQFHGLDQVGETGLQDQVNHHYLQIFGASIAIGMIAGLAQSNTQYGTNAPSTDVYRQGVSNSLSQSSMHVLDRFLNILPTFTIREGQRIKVYLTEDLSLPAYENHRMPSGL